MFDQLKEMVNGETVQLIWNVISGIVVVASGVVATTKTPDPTTIMGKVYKAVELSALVVNNAKEYGKIRSKNKRIADLSEEHLKIMKGKK